MFGNQFYHQTLRRYVIMFGNLFNDITVARINTSGQVVQRIGVPVAYGPKQKFLVRLAQDPNFEREVAVQLPRIGFEITGVNYAPERKLASTQRNVRITAADDKQLLNQYVPVPYDVNMQLNIYVKNADDGTQVLEQILPYFTPEWTTTLRLIDEMDIKMDIPTVLQSTNFEDVYEGDFDTRRAIVWSLDFVVKGYIYGPVRSTGIINRSVIRLSDEIDTRNDVATVDVTPGLTAQGVATANSAATIPRGSISANDDFGFITSIDEDVFGS